MKERERENGKKEKKILCILRPTIPPGLEPDATCCSRDHLTGRRKELVPASSRVDVFQLPAAET